jgi:hypothetical protein
LFVIVLAGYAAVEAVTANTSSPFLLLFKGGGRTVILDVAVVVVMPIHHQQHRGALLHPQSLCYPVAVIVIVMTLQISCPPHNKDAKKKATIGHQEEE